MSGGGSYCSKAKLVGFSSSPFDLGVCELLCSGEHVLKCSPLGQFSSAIVNFPTAVNSSLAPLPNDILCFPL